MFEWDQADLGWAAECGLSRNKIGSESRFIRVLGLGEVG
jgi:hypothetical protein